MIFRVLSPTLKRLRGFIRGRGLLEESGFEKLRRGNVCVSRISRWNQTSQKLYPNEDSNGVFRFCEKGSP